MLGYRNDKINWIEMAKKIEVASGPGKFGGPSQLIPHVSNGRYKPLVVLCGATNQRTREHYRKIKRHAKTSNFSTDRSAKQQTDHLQFE